MKRRVTNMYRNRLYKRFWSRKKVKGISYKGLENFSLTYKNGNKSLLLSPSEEIFSYDLKVSEDKILFPESLESVRLSVNKTLSSKLNKLEYYLRVLVYPHQILREHRMAKGAKADRISEGMRRAFGKANKRAIRVKKDQKIIRILLLKKVDSKIFRDIRKLVQKTTSKITSASKWVVTQ